MLPYALPRAASLKRLLLRVNPLTALPECIRECHNLEELYVSGCPLTMLPDWLDELTALRILEISDTAIPDCPSVLRRLPNLRMLGIANLPWTTLPPWFCDLPLTTLTIDGMPRCDCSPLVGLKQLQHLGLSAMDYTIVPEWIRQLPLLHLLDLSHNPLEILPSWLETIPITTLMLAHVPLAALPDWHTWDRLTTLDLTACHLADAAFRMPLPRNLTHLNLDQNPITQLPSELYQCHSLYACSLANTALTTLPAWFFEDLPLVSLDISGTSLTFPALSQRSMLESFIFGMGKTSAWPYLLTHMPTLRVLDLSDTWLQSQSPSMGHALFPQLETFRGPRDQDRVPLIGAMPNLRVAVLSGGLSRGSREYLSALLGKSPQIQALDLSRWHCNPIPSTLVDLAELQTLNIAHKHLDQVPGWVNDMPYLKSLDLSDNRCTDIPRWMRNMTHLESLDLSGNPLQTFPSWLKDIPTLRDVAFMFPSVNLQCDHVLPEFLAAGIRLDVQYPRDDAE